MNLLGDNKWLSREFNALFRKRGLGVEEVRQPEGVKAGVMYVFNWVWTLSSCSW